MKDTTIPAQLMTPTDLGDKARKEITVIINPLVADAFALFVKTKSFHWHMSGSHYRDYHLLLDEQAEQIFAMIDVLAERVRKVGGTTIRSIKHISELTQVSDEEEIFVPAKEMIRRLLADNKAFVQRMRAAHEIGSKNNDVATTSLLENFIDEGERRVWFLFETQVD